MIGLAFLLVEIPLIQRFILYLGHPAFALATVLFALLVFSGIGSQLSRYIPVRLALTLLILLLLGLPLFLPRLFAWTLGLSLPLRLGLTTLMLSPLGFLMGIPFPAGIRLITRRRAHSPDDEAQEENAPRPEIPWVWAVNGAASVVASVLAALLALTFGFSWVLRFGALCYTVALLTVMGWPRHDHFQHLRQ
jgi:hypothetical protein